MSERDFKGGKSVLMFMGERMTRREIMIARHAHNTAGPHQSDFQTAEQKYPLPKVTRPRVVTRNIGGTLLYFRVKDHVLQSQVRSGGCCPHEHAWDRVDGMIITELEACSTEEVEDES